MVGGYMTRPGSSRVIPCLPIRSRSTWNPISSKIVQGAKRSRSHTSASMVVPRVLVGGGGRDGRLHINPRFQSSTTCLASWCPRGGSNFDQNVHETKSHATVHGTFTSQWLVNEVAPTCEISWFSSWKWSGLLDCMEWIIQQPFDLIFCHAFFKIFHFHGQD